MELAPEKTYKIKRSLNEMVLEALAQANETLENRDFSTARDVTDYIRSTYGINYPIQTIIVVLNRMVAKRLLNRTVCADQDTRNRYGYYLNKLPEDLREEKILNRFQALADEFFHGEQNIALNEIQKLFVKATQPATYTHTMAMATS